MNLLKIKKSFFEEENPFYKIIDNDYYDISNRIKKIDKTLVVVYNALNGKYEVHDLRNKFSTFVMSFKSLDKEIILQLNISKDRDTIKQLQDERAKFKKFTKQKQDERTNDNKNFALRYSYSSVIK